MAGYYAQQKFSDGERPQDYWRSMDVPDRVGTCKKLREGQLLMQRYQWCWHQFQSSSVYYEQAKSGKDRSIILAGRMVKHAEGCVTCQRDRVLEEVFFYGVYS